MRFLTFTFSYPVWPLLSCAFTEDKYDIIPDTINFRYITIEYDRYWTQCKNKKTNIVFRLWTHKKHPIPRRYMRVMGWLVWLLWGKDTARYREYTVYDSKTVDNVTTNVARFQQAYVLMAFPWPRSKSHAFCAVYDTWNLCGYNPCTIGSQSWKTLITWSLMIHTIRTGHN